MGSLIDVFEDDGAFLVLMPIFLQIVYWIMVYKKIKIRYIVVFLCDVLICILPARDLINGTIDEGRNFMTSFANPGISAIFICLLGVVVYWVNIFKHRMKQNI